MFKNKTVYKKFFLIFLTVVVLYTGIIMVGITFNQYQILSRNNDHLNLMFINGTSNLTDYKMELSLNTARDLIGSDNVSVFMDDEPNDYTVLANVNAELSSILTALHPFSFEIGLYRSEDTTMITSNGFFYYEDYLSFIGINEDHFQAPSEFFNDDLASIAFIPEANLARQGESTIIYRLGFEGLERNLYMFITFGRGALTKLLPNELPNDIGHMTLWMNASEETFTSVSSEAYTGFDFNPVNFENPENLNDVIRTTNYDEISYTIGSNAIPGLYYTYVIRKADLVQMDMSSVQIVALSLILLLIIGIMIVFFATKKSYSPIEAILNIITGPESRKEKGLHELDYIIGAVTKINEDHLKLQKDYYFSLGYSQENFFKSIIYNVYVAEDIELSLERLSLTHYRDGGNLAILSLEGLSKVEENLTQSSLLGLRSKFLTTIQDAVSELRFIVVPIDHKKFCLIFETHEVIPVTNFLEEKIEELEKKLHIDLTFSIAKPTHTIEGFHEAFKEACFLNDNRYMYLNTKVITSDSELVISDKSYVYPLETERLLIEAIGNNELEKSRKILTEVLNKNLRELELDNYSMIRFKYAMFNTIKRILNMNNKSILDFFKVNPQLLDEFKHNKSKKIYVTLEAAFESIFDELSIKENVINSYSSRILDYIHENYTEDLSLTIIADHFSLSEGYVSKLFKEATHIKFKTYLGRLKVKKAKVLLKEKKYKVSEVSKMVGYHNVNTFIRVFKDLEGISPGEYKKMYTEDRQV